MAISNETREDFMQSMYDMFSNEANNDRANQIIDMFDIATENCVDLPCKIGDTVYYFLSDSNYNSYEEVEVVGFHIDKYRTAFEIEICGIKILVDVEFLGEKIFLSQDNAEKALKEHKNMAFNPYNTVKNQKKELMQRYPIGTKLRIISLVNEEPHLPNNSEGTVVGYDDQPALLMSWDNGSSLSLLPYSGDRFEKIK